MERSTFEHFLNPKGTYLNTKKKEEEEGVWVRFVPESQAAGCCDG